MAVLLCARNIRVEFGPLVAVDDISFELSAGELLGLVGPNGAGKTTLMRSVCGLQAPTCGTATVMARNVLGDDEVVRRHVSFAPDSPPAYEELTIDQFLQFVAGAYDLTSSETDERIDFWLEQLWLVDRRHTPIKNLSRGMRQRVTLARTFLPQPHVILLDEPLSGLDPAGRIQLRGVLTMLRQQGCALIVSSHILSDLEAVATHIAIIERGRLLRWTTTAALHQEGAVRRTYLLAVLPGRIDPAAVLNGIDDVTRVRTEGNTFSFEFLAEDVAAARLLRQLVEAGVEVLSYTAVKTSLEEAYLRSGVKQVD